MQLLTKDEIAALIEGIWTGQYSPDQLPYWLFVKIADALDQATANGWGNPLGQGATPDIELEMALQKNVFYFAASKTTAELNAFDQLYKATRSKYQFAKEAAKLDRLWNYHWFNTEYNVTTRLARAGRDWRRIEETKDYYPLLRFLAVQDSNTRAEHAALHNVVRPVNDPFWTTYFPPLSWNCRCRTERVRSAAITDLRGVEAPEVLEQFQQRVTDSRKIWDESHPYFTSQTPAEEKRSKRMANQHQKTKQ